MPHIGLTANWAMPASVNLKGIEIRIRSRSRLPPVMLSTEHHDIDAGFCPLHHGAVEPRSR